MIDDFNLENINYKYINYCRAISLAEGVYDKRYS